MASGMAAMTAVLLCQLQAGDHLVGGRAAFGSCRWLTDTLLPKFGIATTVIDARDPQAFPDAVRPETKVFFFETPANPTMDVADLQAICDIARERGSPRSSTMPLRRRHSSGRWISARTSPPIPPPR